MTTPTTLTPFDAARYFRQVPATARRGLRGYVLRVLLDLARLKGEERGTCFPSVSYIAETVGRSVRHVRRCLAELEATGEIKRVYRKRADGGWSSNIYKLNGLISWAAENVRRVSDKRVRKSYSVKESNSLRRSQSGFQGRSASSPCPSQAASVPLARAGTAENGLKAVLSDPERPPAKWRALSPQQISEAQTGCDRVQWNRYRLEASLDGVAVADLDAAAAHKWRADAILRGVAVAS